MALNPNATFKGTLISTMEREELLWVIEQQALEFGKLKHLIDWNKWHEEKLSMEALDLI